MRQIKMDTEDKKEIGELVRNYEKMNETGKEKLKEVSEKILDVWNTVNKREIMTGITN